MRLIQKHQQSNGIGKGTITFSDSAPGRAMQAQMDKEQRDRTTKAQEKLHNYVRDYNTGSLYIPSEDTYYGQTLPETGTTFTESLYNQLQDQIEWEKSHPSTSDNKLVKGWSNFFGDLGTAYQLATDVFPSWVSSKATDGKHYFWKNALGMEDSDIAISEFKQHVEDEKRKKSQVNAVVPEWMALGTPVGYGVKVPQKVLDMRKAALARGRLDKLVKSEEELKALFKAEDWAREFGQYGKTTRGMQSWETQVFGRPEIHSMDSSPEIILSQLKDPSYSYTLNRIMLNNPTVGSRLIMESAASSEEKSKALLNYMQYLKYLKGEIRAGRLNIQTSPYIPTIDDPKFYRFEIEGY